MLLVVSQDEMGEDSSATYQGTLEQRGVAPVKGRFPRDGAPLLFYMDMRDFLDKDLLET